MAKLYAATSPEMSGRERRNMNRVRKAAPGGMVLLENDGTLPLKEMPKQIALYGSGARRTVKGGTGSGDVNSRQIYTIEDGFREAGMEITTTAWMDLYDQLCDQHMQAHVGWITQLIAAEGQAGIQKILEAGYQEPAEPPVDPRRQQRIRQTWRFMCSPETPAKKRTGMWRKATTCCPRWEWRILR